MKHFSEKIFHSFEEFFECLKGWKTSNQKLVFTNGCFDILHRGHIDYLDKSAQLGDKLIIGLNTDVSVRLLKGKQRPYIDEDSRAILLAAIEFVDAVILFDEETPFSLIEKIKPDVLVKGKDYEIHEIAGHDIVLNNGGKVETIELTEGFSTSALIEKIKKSS
ncbi:D-glycero-beta-D-manno-heptose 1-phosphate adenylyltransferase [Sunxiuqinia sp. A32]|uniref:D-glycero-beta-D-manno-heptose 1-phosphate adenylyltransferase n=1 Tax=Sunxiuqinia sp. A32 TaxID=3461496 RepID=UPI0040467FE1